MSRFVIIYRWRNKLRSFIHYLTVRLDPTTQKERRQLARAIYDEINKVFDLSALELTV